jgi:hypothetical protein
LGQKQTYAAQQVMSALPPIATAKADIKRRKRNVRTCVTLAQAMILKSETYHFHRLDLTRQAGFTVTIYDEDGLTLATTKPFSTPAAAFEEARQIVDNKIEGPSVAGGAR